MPPVLTQAQQSERLEYLVGSVLDNFSMAACLANYLIQYHNAKLPPPQATIIFRGHGPPASIPGSNCGFFVNPVMTMAGIDCRRSLQFFGLTFSQKQQSFVPAQRRPDDLGIEAFGLPLVTMEKLLKSTASVLNRPAEPVLVQVHLWTDKQLAHFTYVEDIITTQAIRDASLIMIEAYMSLLFDALGRPRPKLNPSAD
jgi:hypothetical protein